jgi:hypothetical protein
MTGRAHGHLGALAVLGWAIFAGCGNGAPASGGSAGSAIGTATPASGAFALDSPAFADGGAIPVRHTCDGPDVSPALAWRGVPVGTAAFALVVEDLDAGGFVHWVVPAIEDRARSLAEGIAASGPPAQGRNDFGRTGWGGPCPPSGTHRYVFTLYALRDAPDAGGVPTAAELRAAIAGRVIAEARLVGTYGR